MPRQPCPRHEGKFACTCGMGHLYRFVEPVILLLLLQRGEAHGYELANELPKYALTDTEVEAAALYRTLRTLEQNGNVTSRWDTSSSGPARRLYRLTDEGEEHLCEWVAVLGHMSNSMTRFLKAARSVKPPSPKPAE
jgi:PadR family transcriptional regulator, regulatory protein PadR